MTIIKPDDDDTIYDTTGAATYEIRDDGRAIYCRRCNRTSWNAGDVQYKFCVACGFHSDGGAYRGLITRLVGSLLRRK